MCLISVINSAEKSLTKQQFIIFLDIDGVLYREPTRHDFWEERHKKMVGLFGKLDDYWSFHYDVATSYYFDQKAVALLENFIDEMSVRHNVGIVLSTAWREGRTLEELHQVFSPWRFSQYIIDKTVDSNYRNYPSRAAEIDHWLLHHKDMNISHFIIFDDIDSELSKKFPDHFVHIQGSLLREPYITSAREKIQPDFPLPSEDLQDAFNALSENSSSFSIACLDTPHNREIIMKEISRYYGSFLKGKYEIAIFTGYLYRELKREFPKRTFIHLYIPPDNGWDDNPLHTVFRNHWDLRDYKQLFPSDTFSYVAQYNGLIKICINVPSQTSTSK